MIKKISFGSDPEYFVELNNEIIPASKVLKGKYNKLNKIDLGNGYTLEKDNVLLEGNIPPVSNKTEFIKALEELENRIIDYIKEPISLVKKDSHTFESKQLLEKECNIFGCSSYNNCWSLESMRANDLSNKDFRTSGFHLHMGYETSKNTYIVKEIINIALARKFDIEVVIPSYDYHFDERRFDNYGGLGQYRNTLYGIELRSLGSSMLQPEHLDFIFDSLLNVINYFTTDNFEKTVTNLLELDYSELEPRELLKTLKSLSVHSQKTHSKIIA